MKTWRDHISSNFISHTQIPVLAIDPDSLLSEEKLSHEIRSKDFEIIPFEDPVSFRLVHESKYRDLIDRGEEIDLVILVQNDELEQSKIPFDVRAKCKKIHIQGGDVFRQLSPTVISKLGSQFYDDVEKTLSQHQTTKLEERDTKDFILKHVFNADIQTINDTGKLLRFLIQHHYHGKKLPPVLEKHLLDNLNGKPFLREWPIDILVQSESDFFAFLQERWPAFLHKVAGKIDEPKYDLTYPGPLNLPFDQVDIRVYVDNLFNEGFLEPVPYSNPFDSPHQWVNAGIIAPKAKTGFIKLTRTIPAVLKEVPNSEAHHTEWIRFGFRLAEIQRLSFEENHEDSSAIMSFLKSLQEQVDQNFHTWLDRYYGGLYSHPANPPVMIHHIPRYLSHVLHKNKGGKVALLVIDGLSLPQWLAMKTEILKQVGHFRFNETALFSWIPTTTNVSRQALFSGKLPMLFAGSIQNLGKESHFWKQFWTDQGINEENVLFLKAKGQNEELSLIESECMHPRQRVMAIVIEKVDKIMHGMKLGSAGMNNQVKQWASIGFLKNLSLLLMKNDFNIFITSDHGNVEAEGIGRISEGSIAETKGQRVRAYSNSVLREKIKAEKPELIEWPSIGLPDDYLCLLAPNRKAFVTAGETVITHGGACIEEVLIPFINVHSRETQ